MVTDCAPCVTRSWQMSAPELPRADNDHALADEGFTSGVVCGVEGPAFEDLLIINLGGPAGHPEFRKL